MMRRMRVRVAVALALGAATFVIVLSCFTPMPHT